MQKPFLTRKPLFFTAHFFPPFIFSPFPYLFPALFPALFSPALFPTFFPRSIFPALFYPFLFALFPRSFFPTLFFPPCLSCFPEPMGNTFLMTAISFRIYISPPFSPYFATFPGVGICRLWMNHFCPMTI